MIEYRELSEQDVVKATRLLGLARRAGYLIRGEEQVRRALQRGKGELFIVAKDVATGSLQKILPSVESSQVPQVNWSTKEGLGEASGWSETAYLLVTDPSMAKGLLKLYQPL